MDSNKTEFMYSNQDGAICSLNGKSLKLVDKFQYVYSNISSTKRDNNIRISSTWTAIDKLTTIWKYDLSNKIKREFFQTVAELLLLYNCTT